MDNENKKEEEVVTPEENNESKGEGEGEKPEVKTEKKVFTDEEQYAIHQRELKKLGKKLGIEPEPKSKRTKSDDLDYGQKAFLVANGIKGADETTLVKEIMSDTGKSLDEVLESKHFQGTLKDLRDARVSSEAIPKGTKRSSSSSVDDVDFWIAKDELPPDTYENRKLRTDIVNKKIAIEKGKSVFGSGSKLIIK